MNFIKYPLSLLGVIYVLGLFVPGTFLMRGVNLSYAGGEVIQERHLLTSFTAIWTAQVIRLNGDSGIVCAGSGRGFYKKASAPIKHMPLDVWVGSDCALGDGVHILRASWTIELGPWAWTTEAQSQPFHV